VAGIAVGRTAPAPTAPCSQCAATASRAERPDDPAVAARCERSDPEDLRYAPSSGGPVVRAFPTPTAPGIDRARHQPRPASTAPGGSRVVDPESRGVVAHGIAAVDIGMTSTARPHAASPTAATPIAVTPHRGDPASRRPRIAVTPIAVTPIAVTRIAVLEHRQRTAGGPTAPDPRRARARDVRAFAVCCDNFRGAAPPPTGVVAAHCERSLAEDPSAAHQEPA
jgi:hypothetical protein